MNLGNAGQPVRLIADHLLVLAPLVASLALVTEPVWMWGSVFAGTLLIAIAGNGFHPLYAPFGLSTCKVTHQ